MSKLLIDTETLKLRQRSWKTLSNATFRDTAAAAKKYERAAAVAKERQEKLVEKDVKYVPMQRGS